MTPQDWMALDKAQFLDAFFDRAVYCAICPRKPYSIRIGSKSFFSDCTHDLRRQVEKHIALLRARATRERNNKLAAKVNSKH